LQSPAGGTPVIPGYELQERLGSGGQASVYKGIQVSMNRPVAIKIIRAGSEAPETEVGRFMREARVLAKLRHDNIVQAIDYGEHQGVRYLVMEFVEGESVLDIMNRENSLGVLRSTKIALHVCRALENAAKFDVMHRDVKPANIVMTTAGKAILVDFGLAKPGDSDLQVTMAGMTVGTPHYMPPEQIRGESNLDIRVDLYALGGTFFHMLTGRVPFDRDTKAQILISHLRDPVELPPDLTTEIPEDIFQIIKKAMKKNRDKRYQTATEMVKDLEAALARLQGTGSGPVLQAVPTRSVVAPVSSKRRPGRTTPARPAPAPTAQPVGGEVQALKRELEQERARVRAAIKERDDLKAQLLAARSSLEKIRASHQKSTLAQTARPSDTDRMARLEREIVEIRKKAEAEKEMLRRERDRALKEWQAEERRAREAAEEHKSELALRAAPAQSPVDRIAEDLADDELAATDVRMPVFKAPRPPKDDDLARTDVRLPTMGAQAEATPLEKSAREAPMTYVNRGYFIAGEDEGKDVEIPRYQAHLSSFWIDIYPVTNRHYAEYIGETGRTPPQHWKGPTPPDDRLDHPVVWITWQDAAAFAAWCGKRMPTLLEWQKAARGSDGRQFPWGDEIDPTRLNCKETGISTTTMVNRYEDSGSPFGVHDAAGNVAEWVDGQFNLPGVQSTGQVVRAVCGGSYRDTITRSRCASRRGYPDGGKAPFVGFRCARDS
jgi:serine/threonine protein kinase/formylglycine-generating enzyme required for sulfatase activity